MRKNRDPLPTHFVATAEDCTYRAVNIFGTCVTRVMRFTKRAGRMRHVEPGLALPPSCHGLRNKKKAVSTKMPRDHTSAHRATHSVSPVPLPTADTENTRKKWGQGTSCVANLTIPACSHERPERHAHCRVRDDGVPVLQVEPLPARLRQLRVVVQELEQDDDEVDTPRPDPRH